MSDRYRIGVDIGGTFTDGTLINALTGEVRTSKVLTTPDDPSIGFAESVGRLLSDGVAASDIDHVVHATTVATNAIIEGKTAPMAFVTTAGFRDMLEIARQIRPSLYDLQFDKLEPLVERRHCFEVTERLDANGDVITPLDEVSVREVADRIGKSGVESVAVCLLHAYRNSSHEQRVEQILRERLPNISISISSDVAPEFREYFRASTTVINAGIRPVVDRYLETIRQRLDSDGVECDLLVMQSGGGVYAAEEAREKPVFMVESGPAAGVVAAAAMGSALGYPDVISFDMGGTTAKASLVRNGRPSITKDYSVGATAARGDGAFGGAGGHPVRTPVVDLVEVGAGGGSIGWVDSGGALRVGPHSAGASPGPACYGLGGELPTITDANIVLGRLDPTYFAGGEMSLDSGLARKAIEVHCAAKLGISIEEAANGIVEIANTTMVNALRLVSVQRGHDPRDFMLVAFGGAGPAHALRIAEEVGIGRVLIPVEPGTASARGLLSTDIRIERAASVISRSDSVDLATVERTFKEMEADGRATLARSASAHSSVEFERAVEMRYYGQSFELTVPAPGLEVGNPWLAELLARFHEAHEQAYGFQVPSEPVEIVNLRSTTVGQIRKPELRKLKAVSGATASPKSKRQVYFAESGGYLDTPVFDRSILAATARIAGPAIIEERDSTTVVNGIWIAEVDQFGNLLISRG